MRTLAILWVCMTIVVSFAAAAAHGLGKQQLARVEAGPFLISAWTDPVDANTAEEIHVTVAVEDENGLVRRADVQVEAILLDDASVSQIRTATHERAVNKLQYEAPLNLETVGNYTVTIYVDNGEAQAQADFELEVQAGGGLPFSPGWMIVIAGGILMVVLVVWNRLKLFRDKKESEQAL